LAAGFELSQGRVGWEEKRPRTAGERWGLPSLQPMPWASSTTKFSTEDPHSSELPLPLVLPALPSSAQCWEQDLDSGLILAPAQTLFGT
jgi:hypothetical protein